jgi:DNA polymerase III subunit gamma/tau
MAYEVTATRKRPKNFDELIGQDFVVASLKNSLASDRIAHAFLFSGPRGVGKTSAARILAKSLNCENGPTPEPCGECSNCNEISFGNAIDVIEIDGASNTSVNDVREIKDEVLFSPSNSRYKVYIIDEVHMLSHSAFNALLKTIEEPPHYIVFIFATTEINKVPATIRSRCQQFNFRLISINDITKRLKEAADDLNIKAEEDALFWIAKEATGSLRDAYTLLDQVVSFSDGHITLDKILDKLGLVSFDRLNKMSNLLLEEKTDQAIELIDDLIGSGVSIEQIVMDLTEYYRSVLFIQYGVKKESVLGFPLTQFSEKVISEYNSYQVEKIEEILFEVYRNLKYSLNPRYETELAICRIANIKKYISPSEIIEKINTIRLELMRNNTDRDSGETLEKPKPRNLEQENIDKIISAVRKEKPALSSILETALGWEMLDNELNLIFDNSFRANSVQQESALLKEIIEKMLDKKMNLNVIIDSQNTINEKNTPVSQQVEMVKKVFRGEEV